MMIVFLWMVVGRGREEEMWMGLATENGGSSKRLEWRERSTNSNQRFPYPPYTHPSSNNEKVKVKEKEKGDKEIVEQLFATTRELLVLVHRLAVKSVFTISVRGLRKVVCGIVDLVGCADFVFPSPSSSSTTTSNSNNSQQTTKRQHRTDTQRIAIKTGKTCVRVLKAFCGKGVGVEPRSRRESAREVVLRSLLVCGQVNPHSSAERSASGGEDVVGRVRRVLELIEVVLPLSSCSSSSSSEVDGAPMMDGDHQMQDSLTPSSSSQQELKSLWSTTVFPLILHELRLFMRLLPVEDKVRFVGMLVDVDVDGAVGVGEWLVQEEVKEVEGVGRWLMCVGEMYHLDDDDEEEVVGEGKVQEKEQGGEAMEGVEGAGTEGGEEKEKARVMEEQRKKREMKVQKKKEREVLRAERMINLHRVFVGVQFLSLLTSTLAPPQNNPNNTNTPWFITALSQTPTLASQLASLLSLLLEAHYTSPPITSLFKVLSRLENFGRLGDERLKLVALLGVLRIAQGDVTSVGAGDGVKEMLEDGGLRKALFRSEAQDGDVDLLRSEVGRLCAVCAESVGMVSVQVAEMVVLVLAWMTGSAEGVSKGEERPAKMKVLRGVTRDAFTTLCDSLVITIPEMERVVHDVRTTVGFDEDEDFVAIPVELPDTLVLSLSSISSLLLNPHPSTHSAPSLHPSTSTTTSSSSHNRTGSLSTLQFSGGYPIGTNTSSGSLEGGGRPSTPKGGQKTPDILGTIISPPTALLRSPAATGLTKTYVNNDFRSLRQVPSARLNTSRLPSTHVDDFESGGVVGAGPTVPGASMSPLIVPVPIPLGDVSAFGDYRANPGLIRFYSSSEKPSQSLCLAQASLLYGITPMWAVAVLALVSYMLYTLRDEHTESRYLKSIPMALMLSAPYIAQSAFTIAALLMAYRHPKKLKPDSLFLFCSFKDTKLFFAMSIFTLLACVAIIGIEVALAIVIYRSWRTVRSVGLPSDLPLPLIARVFVFGVYVGIGIIVSTLGLFDITMPENLFAATAGTVVFLIFGTQADVFRAWCFWRKDKTNPPPPSSPSISTHSTQRTHQFSVEIRPHYASSMDAIFRSAKSETSAPRSNRSSRSHSRPSTQRFSRFSNKNFVRLPDDVEVTHTPHSERFAHGTFPEEIPPVPEMTERPEPAIIRPRKGSTGEPPPTGGLGRLDAASRKRRLDDPPKPKGPRKASFSSLRTASVSISASPNVQAPIAAVRPLEFAPMSTEPQRTLVTIVRTPPTP
ncbi:hypothetical protein NP233_g3207 [Leucocoprinus birnbaumii]|uniref:Uncharacterized protein n=1 Tax=Leucocoprinus birnbaumii TaxID=56174 RepID=A0AAD5YU58_9AGAR|nr:hypothetical protein NP233_g3207 [Leucocoprinus birnbaumii]